MGKANLRDIDIEAFTADLCSHTRWEVAKKYGVPYDQTCAFANLIGASVQATTFERRFQRAIKLLEQVEQIAPSVLTTRVRGVGDSERLLERIKTERPDLAVKIRRRKKPTPEWLQERRRNRRQQTREAFEKNPQLSVSEIAKIVGVSRESVYQYLNEEGLRGRTKRK